MALIKSDIGSLCLTDDPTPLSWDRGEEQLSAWFDASKDVKY
jgi:hypothetical protein